MGNILRPEALSLVNPVPARPRPPKKTAAKSTAPESAGLERLQKVLAAAGIGSRRECEALITEGRVEVDGEVVQELGSRVDPVRQRIRVDGTTLPSPKRAYYILNKPAGILCTNNDPSGRARAIDLIRSQERLFTVGRLDQASEGLILVTNDGELANKLTHPRYGIEKVYRVRVAGAPEPEMLGKLRRGVHFAEGLAKVSDVKIKSRHKQSTELEIILNEGRNREIRRLLARIGHKVLTLTRIALGPLRLGELPTGAHRSLTREEVKLLRHAVDKPSSEKSRAKPAASAKDVSPRAGSTARPKRPFASPASAAQGKPKPNKSLGAKPQPAKSESFTPRRAKLVVPSTSFQDTPKPGAILGGDDAPPAPQAKPQPKPRAKSSGRKFGTKGRR